MIHVTFYTRTDCHLCDEARQYLAELQSEVPHELVEIDVDSTSELRRQFGFEVPVITTGPFTLRAPIDKRALAVTLHAASDRQRQVDSLNDPQWRLKPIPGEVWTAADSFGRWLANHYILLINAFVLIYLGLPFLAPVLMRAGATGPAEVIYRSYSLFCHQLAFRSFFLFGEQPFYPRAEAGVAGYQTFEQAAGVADTTAAAELLTARAFVGNEQLGFKVALCERDVAIYGAIFAFGLVFAATRRRLPKLPWYWWIVLGLVPIGLDGVSQLLSQPPLNFIAFRESTPLLRVLTGSLFGFFTAWFGYPFVEESMVESRQALEWKRKRTALARQASGQQA